MSYIKRTFIVENTWTCTTCQHQNLGRHMKCQSCGAVKAQDAEEQLSGPDAPAVEDPELQRLANEGANWFCTYCDGQTRDEYGKCRNCGAGRDGPEPAPREKQDYTPPSAPAPRVTAKPEPSCISKPAPKRDWLRILSFAGLVPLFVILVTVVVNIFRMHEVNAKVSSVSWVYTAQLHQRTLMHGSDWRPIRSGAFNIRCENRYYGDEDCHPHDCRPHPVGYSCNCRSYECNCHTSCTSRKNGFSSCSETCSTCSKCETCYRTEYDTCYDRCPVYRDHCDYDYYTWPVIATKTTSGGNHAVHWPLLTARVGDQRLDRSERYSVKFTGEKTWDYSPGSLREFNYFNVGALWKIKVNRAGMVRPQHILK